MTRQEKELIGKEKAFADFVDFIDFVEDNHTIQYVIITHNDKNTYGKKSYISVHYKEDGHNKYFYLLDVWQDIESEARFCKVSAMVEKYCKINNIRIK